MVTWHLLAVALALVCFGLAILRRGVQPDWNGLIAGGLLALMVALSPWP